MQLHNAFNINNNNNNNNEWVTETHNILSNIIIIINIFIILY